MVRLKLEGLEGLSIRNQIHVPGWRNRSCRSKRDLALHVHIVSHWSIHSQKGCAFLMITIVDLELLYSTTYSFGRRRRSILVP